jgi:hypothetical protein
MVMVVMMGRCEVCVECHAILYQMITNESRTNRKKLKFTFFRISTSQKGGFHGINIKSPAIAWHRGVLGAWHAVYVQGLAGGESGKLLRKQRLPDTSISKFE